MHYRRVLVTGGAGFIGSNIAEELAKGNEVVILDDLSTGAIENIEELIKNKNVKFIRGSITDLGLLRRSLEGIDYVFHLAALPSVPRSIEDPISCNNVNINGTLNVLIAARDNQIKKVVYSSSCAVYGDSATTLIAEAAMLNPKSPYAVSKLTGEHYCALFNEIYHLPTISLRYFNVYGPHQNPDSEYAAVIPKFIQNAMDGMPLIIYGDGLQTRDFVSVKDVVRANILAAESNETGVFNIGCGASTTINKLAKAIINLLGKNTTPVHKEPREGDIRYSQANISKAKSFGYEPMYSLEDGLKETIRWFNECV